MVNFKERILLNITKYLKTLLLTENSAILKCSNIYINDNEYEISTENKDVIEKK